MRWGSLLFFLALGLQAGAANASGLCQTHEAAIFVCDTHARKTIAVCERNWGAQDASLIYRYGKRGHIELSYPATPSEAQSAFTKYTYSWPKGSEAQLEFTHAGTRYTIFSFVSAIEGENHGVYIVPAQGKPVTIACTPKQRLGLWHIEKRHMAQHERRDIP